MKLVACEVAYALAPGADVPSARNAVYDRLAETYPLPGPVPQQVTVHVRPGGPVTQQMDHGFRFLDRERLHSVVATPESLIVETSHYTRFEHFVERVTEAVTALREYVSVAAAIRVGLRYIDEIPLAELPENRFDPYFTASVMAPARAVPDVGEPVEFMTTSRFSVGPDTNTVMRTGVLQTPVVSPEGPLRIEKPSTPPLFLIDVDSAWEAVMTAPRAFERDAVSDLLYELHAPVHALFEHSITDKLRDDLLRKEASA